MKVTSPAGAHATRCLESIHVASGIFGSVNIAVVHMCHRTELILEEELCKTYSF